MEASKYGSRAARNRLIWTSLFGMQDGNGTIAAFGRQLLASMKCEALPLEAFVCVDPDDLVAIKQEYGFEPDSEWTAKRAKKEPSYQEENRMLFDMFEMEWPPQKGIIDLVDVLPSLGRLLGLKADSCPE